METKHAPAHDAHTSQAEHTDHGEHEHAASRHGTKQMNWPRAAARGLAVLFLGLAGFALIGTNAGQAFNTLKYRQHDMVVGGTISDGSCADGLATYLLTDQTDNTIYRVHCVDGINSGQTIKAYQLKGHDEAYISLFTQMATWLFQFVAGLALIAMAVYFGRPLYRHLRQSTLS